MVKGYIALTTVIAVSAVVLVIAISTSLLSISEMQMSLVSRSEERALNLIEACVEEGLLKTNIDRNYNGGTITLPEGECTASVTKNGNNWSMIMSGTFEGFAKQVKVDFRRTSTIEIENWQEI